MHKSFCRGTHVSAVSGAPRSSLFNGAPRCLRSLLAAAACAACAVAQPPVARDADYVEDDPMRWDRAESEVGHDRFSYEYIDSLKESRGVGDSRGLGQARRLPFTREKLVFDGGWGWIRAGWAILKAGPAKDTTLINFSGKVVTNNFVSTFYKVRDYVQAHCDARSLYPLFFEQHIKEGRYRDERWTLFDHTGGMVYYKSEKGEIESPAEPGIQNYLSLLYLLRTMDFAPRDSFNIRCFYHRQDFPIWFTVYGIETVKVPAGTFTCWKIEPRLVGEGRGFTRRDRIVVWLTDDAVKMPVLVKAKINIGSLSARLLYYERD